MSKSPRPSADASGFSLVEAIVVLAVVLLLTGVAVPMVRGFMSDGRRARAEADVKAIAHAVTSFYRDVGVWPARNAAGVNNVLYTLCSGPAAPATNPFANTNNICTWLMDGTHGDTLDNHLVRNTPGGSAGGAYPTAGNVRWRGPYATTATPLDPWGRPYLVTVRSGTSTNATNFKRMFVLSAGPDGAIDTPATLSATTELAGDDVGLLISIRQ